MHLTKLSLAIYIVLNGQQQANYTSMTAAWLSSLGPWQHNGIGGFGKWDGLLISYCSLIKIQVYCCTGVFFLISLA